MDFMESKPHLELFWIDSMLDFLYGMDWRRVVDEKCVKIQNPAHFWAKTLRVYRYRLSCTGIGMQWVTCTGTVQGCTGTGVQWVIYTSTGQGCTGTGCAEGNLYWYRSKVYRYRLFQQPCFDMFSHR